MRNDKKLAAAMAAVAMYVKTEEEALLSPPPEKKKPSSGVNLWGISSRQAIMQMRNLMQLKTFNRLR